MGYRFVRPRKAERRIQSDSYFAGPWGILVFVGIMVAVGFGVIAIIRKSYDTAEGNKTESASKGGIPIKSNKPTGTQGGWAPTSEPKKGGALREPVSQPKQTVQQALNELNVAVVAKEVARLKGDASGAARQAGVAVSAQERFQSFPGSETAPEHLMASDQIVAVDGEDIESMKALDAAARLSRVLRPESANNNYRFRIRRGPQTLDIQIFIARDASSGATEFTSSGRIKISTYLGLEIQKQVLSLPINVLPQSERVEIERILGKGEATPEEYAMLTRRLAQNESGQIDQERDAFRAQIATLQKMLPTAPVPDVLTTKDGRKIVGSLSADTQRAVVMETPYAKIEILRGNVQHLKIAQEVRDEFNQRLEGSRDKPQGLMLLMNWTRDMQMPVHREYVAFLCLQLLPQDPTAREAAGYIQAGSGKWTIGNSIASGAKPGVKRAESRGELQAELDALGFVQLSGKWYMKVAWAATIDTLHNPLPPSFKMSMSGCQIFTWYENDSPDARLINPSGKPKDGSPPRLRFVAPTGQTGSATVTVEAPDDLYECKVKAMSLIVDRYKQGKIECLITPEGTSTQSLFNIDGAVDEFYHDVSSLVRGKKRFTITVRMNTTMDKFQTYARFLPSLPDSKEVFGVKGTILQPAPEVDRTWAGTRP